MAASPQQAADWQDETQLRNHYCDGWTLCVTWPTCYSFISFIPGCSRMWGGVNKASSSVWRVEVECPLKHDQRPMMLSPHPRHHVYRTLLRLIVSVDHPVCSVIGQSMRIMPVCMGLMFARSFAVITLWSCKMYFAFICACKLTNTVSWILVAVTSVGKKHTYTMQK